jgi:hypothetical protein
VSAGVFTIGPGRGGYQRHPGAAVGGHRHAAGGRGRRGACGAVWRRHASSSIPHPVCSCQSHLFVWRPTDQVNHTQHEIYSGMLSAPHHCDAAASMRRRQACPASCCAYSHWCGGPQYLAHWTTVLHWLIIGPAAAILNTRVETWKRPGVAFAMLTTSSSSTMSFTIIRDGQMLYVCSCSTCALVAPGARSPEM